MHGQIIGISGRIICMWERENLKWFKIYIYTVQSAPLISSLCSMKGFVVILFYLFSTKPRLHHWGLVASYLLRKWSDFRPITAQNVDYVTWTTANRKRSVSEYRWEIQCLGNVRWLWSQLIVADRTWPSSRNTNEGADLQQAPFRQGWTRFFVFCEKRIPGEINISKVLNIYLLCLAVARACVS